jgi:hypothetical protein
MLARLLNPDDFVCHHNYRFDAHLEGSHDLAESEMSKV